MTEKKAPLFGKLSVKYREKSENRRYFGDQTPVLGRKLELPEIFTDSGTSY